MSDWSKNPADFEFDFLACAMLGNGWDAGDFVLAYDEGTRVYLVAAEHPPSGLVIEGAIHTGLIYNAAGGLAHHMRHKLNDELARR